MLVVHGPCPPTPSPQAELLVLMGCPLASARAAVPIDRSLASELERALVDPAPARLDDGGAIKRGYDGELDAHRMLRDDSRRIVAALQLDYAQRYGVASLKIKHHAQLGYVIEVPAAAVEELRKFPELSLRQGMANGARFTAPDLSDLDQRIREASERAARGKRSSSRIWFSSCCGKGMRCRVVPMRWPFSMPHNRRPGSPRAATGYDPWSRRARNSRSPVAVTRWSRPRYRARPPSCRTSATSRRTVV